MHPTCKSGALIAAAAVAMLLSGSVAASDTDSNRSTKHFNEFNGCGGVAIGGGGSQASSVSETRARNEARLVREAKKGNAKAQNELGMRYEQGADVEQNIAKAAEWYRAAAELGHAEAQHNLARLYYNGTGMAPDYRQASEWFEKAASQGDARAAAILGVLYSRGDKVEKDLKKAASWTGKAAALGNAGAQYELGVFYLNGQGLQKDMLQAYKWFVIAESGGYKSAAAVRQQIEPNLSSEEIAAVQAQIKEQGPAQNKAAI